MDVEPKRNGKIHILTLHVHDDVACHDLFMMAGVWFRVHPPEPEVNLPFTERSGVHVVPPRNAFQVQYFLTLFTVNLMREIYTPN